MPRLLIVTGILALWLHCRGCAPRRAASRRCVFCLFIIYDTHLITSQLEYDARVIVAIELYLDVVNLFLFLLACCRARGRRAVSRATAA